MWHFNIAVIYVVINQHEYWILLPVCLVIKPHGKSIDIAIVGSWQEILKNIKDTIDISYATTIINFNRLE